MAGQPIGLDLYAVDRVILDEARKLALTLHCRVLFVDGLMHGAVDFPRDLELNVGDRLDLAGFGTTLIHKVTNGQVWVRRVQLIPNKE